MAVEIEIEIERVEMSSERWYYSTLETAIADGPVRAPAAQWRAWLDGCQRRGEVSAEERAWVGIDAWLDQQAGRISREGVLAYAQEHALQLGEVVLGEGAFAERVGSWWRIRNDDGQVIQVLPISVFPTESEAMRAAGQPDKGGAPKYASYRIPGGESYRELLLTLREKPRKVSAEEQALIDKKDWAELAAMQRRGEIAPPQPVGYESPHWGQSNVLAHVRFDERIGADGKRVLFIHEVQSDWHQEGRTKGYCDPRAAERETDARKAYRDAIRCDAPDAEQDRLKAELDVAVAAKGGVPDAPFKRTDDWVRLAMKRMARWAADKGFDRIAWVTGEQAADVFSLSKQVELIRVMPNPDRSRRVRIYLASSAERPAFEVGPDGSIEPDSSSSEPFRGKLLADVVGKDMAEKIMAVEERRDFTGVELQVGGEGMRGFYDWILPAAVGTWARKFGAKVGQTRIRRTLGDNPGADFHAIDLTPELKAAARRGFPLFGLSEGRRPGQSLRGAPAVRDAAEDESEMEIGGPAP